MSKSTDTIRKNANEIYKMILEVTSTSDLKPEELKDLRDSLKSKITNSMIHDTMALRKRNEHKQFIETHLNYIAKNDVSKENLESM